MTEAKQSGSVCPDDFSPSACINLAYINQGLAVPFEPSPTINEQHALRTHMGLVVSDGIGNACDICRGWYWSAVRTLREDSENINVVE